MTIPVWPEALPQYLIFNGYKEAPPDVVLASKMEIGPDKLRRRASNGPRPIQGKLPPLTSAQVDVLLDFYEIDLLDGSLRFSWLHPRTGAPAEFRFVSRPEPTGDDASAAYTVALDLEILP